MREIKFRGKASEKTENTICMATYKRGDWVYGLVGYIGKYGSNMTNEIGIVGIKVDTDTIGQFTGLYDKNGKEIYEGDIVKMRLGCELCDQTEYDIVCKITYGLLGYGSQIGFSGEAKDGQAISLAGQGFLEVIGNIYDNPELLER